MEIYQEKSELSAKSQLGTNLLPAVEKASLSSTTMNLYPTLYAD